MSSLKLKYMLVEEGKELLNNQIWKAEFKQQQNHLKFVSIHKKCWEKLL